MGEVRVTWGEVRATLVQTTCERSGHYLSGKTPVPATWLESEKDSVWTYHDNGNMPKVGDYTSYP